MGVKLERYVPLVFKIIVLVLAVIFLSTYKGLIVVIAFEFLDLAKNFLKKTIPTIPVDLVFIFGITASYFYSPIYGIIIFVLGILNRVFAMCVETRHLTKAVRHIFLFFLIIMFRHTTFFYAAVFMLVLNYIMKYVMNLLGNPVGYFLKSPFHIMNFTISVIAFYFIDMIYYWIPILG